MIRERAKELVAALRSGEYVQTRSSLRNGGGFCCLGVACEISGLGKWRDGDPDERGRICYVIGLSEIDDNVLPPSVRRHFGMTSSNGSFDSLLLPDLPGPKIFCLSEMNDSGWSFGEIADFIEKHWHKL